MNRDRVFWALPMPGTEGGRTITNLVQPYEHQLTLQSASNPVTNWNIKQSAGGFSSFRFDANNSGAKSLIGPSLRLQLPFTMSVWANGYDTFASGGGATVFGIWSNDSNSSPFLSACIFVNSADISRLNFGSNSSGTYYSENFGNTTYPYQNRNTKYTIVATAAKRILYINGLSYAEDTTARTSPTYGATAGISLGEYIGTLNRTANLDISDGSFWSRALSAEEVLEDYRECMAGYPNLLNRAVSPSQRWNSLSSVYSIDGMFGSNYVVSSL